MPGLFLPPAQLTLTSAQNVVTKLQSLTQFIQENFVNPQL